MFFVQLWAHKRQNWGDRLKTKKYSVQFVLFQLYKLLSSLVTVTRARNIQTVQGLQTEKSSLHLYILLWGWFQLYKLLVFSLGLFSWQAPKISRRKRRTYCNIRTICMAGGRESMILAMLFLIESQYSVTQTHFLYKLIPLFRQCGP